MRCVLALLAVSAATFWSTALAAPAAPPSSVQNIQTRQLTGPEPLTFSLHKHTSRLALNPSDRRLGTSTGTDDTFGFIATASHHLGTASFLANGSSNTSSSYYGVLKSHKTGLCVGGPSEPDSPGDEEPFLGKECSWADDQSQALQTFRAVFKSGVSGGSVRAAAHAPVRATLYFTGPYPGMPTTNYYGSGNSSSGDISYNAMIYEGVLSLGA